MCSKVAKHSGLWDHKIPHRPLSEAGFDMRKGFPFLDLRFLPGSRFFGRARGHGVISSGGSACGSGALRGCPVLPVRNRAGFCSERRGSGHSPPGTAGLRSGWWPGAATAPGRAVSPHPGSVRSEQERSGEARPPRSPLRRPPRPARPLRHPRARPAHLPLAARQLKRYVTGMAVSESTNTPVAAEALIPAAGAQPSAAPSPRHRPPAPARRPPRHAKVKSASETGAARRSSGRSGSASARRGLTPLPSPLPGGRCRPLDSGCGSSPALPCPAEAMCQGTAGTAPPAEAARDNRAGGAARNRGGHSRGEEIRSERCWMERQGVLGPASAELPEKALKNVCVSFSI